MHTYVHKYIIEEIDLIIHWKLCKDKPPTMFRLVPDEIEEQIAEIQQTLEQHKGLSQLVSTLIS